MCEITYSNLIYTGCGHTVAREPVLIPCALQDKPDHPVCESYLASKRMPGNCGRPECKDKSSSDQHQN